ncbi:MAG: antitoxin Xre-like helix-turn-helix domain-containing protein [Verrucomicrobiota bacterium]
MKATLSYPVGRYETAKLVDLNDKSERVRLSPPAIRGFFKIVDRWGVRDEEGRQLLGGISNGAYYALKKDSDRILDPDTLTRISYLVGIFKGLHILYSEKLADEWVSLPNKNRIFGGAAPLSYMMRGGTAAMQIVRRLVDARRGGL